MWAYINRLYRQISLFKQSAGMLYFVFGQSLTFFFRDGLRLAPDSPYFSLAALIGSLILMIPSNFLVKLYRPNPMMVKVGWGFLLVAIWYMYFYNPNEMFFNYFREVGNYLFILAFFILLLHIPNEIEDYVLPVIVLITFLASIGLIYTVFKNPTFVLGMRVAIASGDGTNDVGNPHVYGRNGLAGFIASCLLLGHRNILYKLLCYANILISIAVIIMAQARGVWLAWLIGIGFYIVFHFRYENFKKGVKSFFTPANLVVTVAILGVGIYYLSHNKAILDFYDVYSNGIVRQWDRISSTLLGQATAAREDYALYDESAANRVTTFGLFWRYYEDYGSELILGKGYKTFYFDLPIIQTLVDCGVIGFILFLATNLFCIKYSIDAMRTHESPLTAFLGYNYWAYFVAMLTGGQPYDTVFWFYCMLMIRFMGLPFYKNSTANQLSSA